eukprot:c15763_g1_i2.p1 GENE.c15763_g1_i2~~c15763_g1_i2.p1  ORF type:complete len:205 (+),score=40.59 c15763_g1_i2:34-615(+)
MSAGRSEKEEWTLWVPDKGSYILARPLNKVPSAPEKRVVKTLEDEETEIDDSKCYPTNPANLDGVEDNTMLMHLHEPGLLHNLDCRYADDLIYTYTAYILVAVNPYKDVSKGMYGMDMVNKYRGKSIGVLPPHVLHQWVRALESEDPLVQKWFENWAFLRNDKAREMIINALTPLAEDPYELALDYELAMWDL